MLGVVHPEVLDALPQKFTPGETSGIPAAFAVACNAGQSAAACCGERLAPDLKLGSLNPSRYLEPDGMGFLAAPSSATIGSNSIASLPPDGRPVAQLYHHEMPGGDAVGSKAVVGASLAAMPRLHPLPAP